LFGKLALYGILVPLISGFIYSVFDELLFNKLLGEIKMLGNGPIYEAPMEWIFKAFEIYTIGFYIYVLVNRYFTTKLLKILGLIIFLLIPGFLGGIQFQSGFWIAFLRSIICNGIFYVLYYVMDHFMPSFSGKQK
jgi:predicted membrane metal-binding protein